MHSSFITRIRLIQFCYVCLNWCVVKIRFVSLNFQSCISTWSWPYVDIASIANPVRSQKFGTVMTKWKVEIGIVTFWKFQKLTNVAFSIISLICFLFQFDLNFDWSLLLKLLVLNWVIRYTLMVQLKKTMLVNRSYSYSKNHRS